MHQLVGNFRQFEWNRLFQIQGKKINRWGKRGSVSQFTQQSFGLHLCTLKMQKSDSLKSPYFSISLHNVTSQRTLVHETQTTLKLCEILPSLITSGTNAVSGPGGSVGIATELRAGQSEIKSWWGRKFPPVQTGPGAYADPCKMGTESFPGVKCGGAYC